MKDAKTFEGYINYVVGTVKKAIIDIRGLKILSDQEKDFAIDNLEYVLEQADKIDAYSNNSALTFKKIKDLESCFASSLYISSPLCPLCNSEHMYKFHGKYECPSCHHTIQIANL